VNPPITDAAVSGMPPSQAGVAVGCGGDEPPGRPDARRRRGGAVATARVDGSVHAQLATASHPAWWLITATGPGSWH
jgi:hypothetical protein